MTPNNKTQTMGVYALGIPSIAVITQSHQAADATGEDVSANKQTNPVTTELKAKSLFTTRHPHRRGGRSCRRRVRHRP